MFQFVLIVLTLGCSAALPVELDVSPAVTTVVIARWSTPEPSLGRVLWGAAEAGEHVVEETGEPRTEHELAIAGLHPDAPYRFQVEADGVDRSWQSAERGLTSGSLPPSLADFQVVGDPSAFDGYLPMALAGSASGITVVDATGAVVWYYRFPDPAWLPRRVWYLPQQRRFVVDAANRDEGTVVRWISMDGNDIQELPAEGHDHDFVVLPGGDLLLIVEDIRQVDGQQVIGDSLVRMSPDGSRTTVWSVWDVYDFDDQPVPNDGDWTHANAVDYLPQRNLVLLGLRHFNSILALDATDFSVQWALGGLVSTVQVDQDSAFLHQHQFQLQDNDHMLVFDNHVGTGTAQDSRVIELALDLQAGTATQTWEYHHDPPTEVIVLGNVEALPDGDRLVTWSSAGEVQVVQPDGAVAWQLNTILGTAIGYGDRFDAF